MTDQANRLAERQEVADGVSAIPVLALDLATKTGWAYSDRRGQRRSGVQAFPKSLGEIGDRLLAFHKWLRGISGLARLGQDGLQRPGVFAYEAPISAMRGFAGGMGRELVAVTLLEAASVGKRTLAIYPPTLKKWATGSGRASKPDMVAAAEARNPGLEILDDNHADALLILDWALEDIGQARS